MRQKSFARKSLELVGHVCVFLQLATSLTGKFITATPLRLPKWFPSHQCEEKTPALSGAQTEYFVAPTLNCSASSEFSEDFRCENTFDGNNGEWATRSEGVGSWIKVGHTTRHGLSSFSSRTTFLTWPFENTYEEEKKLFSTRNLYHTMYISAVF